MSQAGYTPISLYYSTTAAAVPTSGNLVAGELAINTLDGKLYYKNSAGTVTLLASSTTVTNSFSAGTTGLTPNTATTGAVTLAGTLVVGNGGTGQTTLATGALGYGQGASAHASLAIGTAGQILTVNSGATAPQWTTLTGVAVTTFSAGTTGLTPSTATSGAVTLAGTLATTNGGTGLTSFTSGGVVYASSTSALTTGSALNFDGTKLEVAGNALLSGASGYKYLYFNGSTDSSSLRFAKIGKNYDSPYDFGVWASTATTGNSAPTVFYRDIATESMRIDTAGALLVGTSSNGWTAYGGISEFRKDQNSSSLLTVSNQNSGSSGSAGTLFSAYGNSWVTSIGTSAKDGNSLTWALDAAAAPPSVKMTLSTAGNLGVGATPSPWAGYAALQVSSGFSAWSSGAANARMNANTYYNGGYRYVGTGTATQYEQDGYHSWYSAVAGTAGNLITFYETMSVDISGNLTVTAAPGNLTRIALNGSAASGTNYQIKQGITSISNGGLSFVDTTNNVIRMAIGASGGVAVGTGSVAGAFTIGGSGALQQYFISSTGTTVDNAIVSLCNNGLSYSALVFDAATYKFSNSGTAALAIASNGNVNVGGSGASAFKLYVNDSVGVRGQNDAQFSIAGSGYAAFHFLDNTAYYIGQNSNIRDVRIYSGSNTAVGVVLGAGATSWSSYSDERMKDIIEPIENALQKVLTLRTVIGRYKVDAADKRRVMMLAQDVKAVLPEATTEHSDGMLSMAYDNIIPLLVAAVKELANELSAYKASHP